MNRYLLLASVTIISVLFQLPTIQDLVIWDAALIRAGQWWRIISGNFTHTNTYHLLMNMVALWIISTIFRPQARSLATLLLLLSMSTGISLLASDLGRYAGLSGVLHGLFTCYAAHELCQGRKSSGLLLLGVVTKVGYEQWFGAAESTARLIGARIATDAHLAGVIAGACLASAWCIYTGYQKDKKLPSE